MLPLGHLDRDGLEPLQPRPATEGAPAGAISAQQLGLVARADLTHVDPAVELRRELSHQLSEIDAGLGGERKHELRAVQLLLDLNQLLRQPALLDFHRAHPVGLAFAMLLLQTSRDVLRRGGRRGSPCGQLWHRPSDGPIRTVLAARHGDRLSRVEWWLEVDLGKQKTMNAPDSIDFDAHKWAASPA